MEALLTNRPLISLKVNEPYHKLFTIFKSKVTSLSGKISVRHHDYNRLIISVLKCPGDHGPCPIQENCEILSPAYGTEGSVITQRVPYDDQSSPEGKEAGIDDVIS